MAWKAKMVELLGQPGVKAHGRLPQPELEEEMRKAAVFAYPTHFGEINCISGLKAQASGCEPVVVNYGALKETVQYGRKVEGDIYDDETKEEFKKQLIDALQNPMKEPVREKMMQWAQEKYSWDKVAASWTEVFNS
jgi:glycosyltransferase involved in cell wall biosynthesis